MNKSTINTAYDQLSKYCVYHIESDDMMEVTEWTNGEGVDISIERTKLCEMRSERVSLTHGELDALIAVSNFLRGGSDG